MDKISSINFPVDFSPINACWLLFDFLKNTTFWSTLFPLFCSFIIIIAFPLLLFLLLLVVVLLLLLCSFVRYRCGWNLVHLGYNSKSAEWMNWLVSWLVSSGCNSSAMPRDLHLSISAEDISSLVDDCLICVFVVLCCVVLWCVVCVYIVLYCIVCLFEYSINCVLVIVIVVYCLYSVCVCCVDWLFIVDYVMVFLFCCVCALVWW